MDAQPVAIAGLPLATPSATLLPQRANPPLQQTAARARSFAFCRHRQARLRQLNGNPLGGSHFQLIHFCISEILCYGKADQLFLEAGSLL